MITANNKPHVLDIKTIIYASAGVEDDGITPIDISSATKVSIKYQKPSGATGEWVGTVHTDNNSVKYIVVENDFDEIGYYYCNIYVESPDWTGHGEVFSFYVLNIGKTIGGV
jgi:hypothetical protein